MENITYFQRRRSWTQLAEAAAGQLNQSGRILMSDYEIFRVIWSIYNHRTAKNLRGSHPSKEVYLRTRSMLRDAGIIRQDDNYTMFWRIMAVSDAPADIVVCQADPYCYISHLSAMQRYGLTNRRPTSLFITSPTDVTVRSWNKNRTMSDFGNIINKEDIYIEPLLVTHHPNNVRRRPIDQLKTKFYGDWRTVRGQDTRVASIGQVFLDMVDDPARCGGMRHVLDVWKEHAVKYLDQIVKVVDASERKICKVRAGYILDEYLGVDNSTVASWLKFAERGGSRVLEAGRGYAEPFSEKWMMSVNVG